MSAISIKFSAVPRSVTAVSAHVTGGEFAVAPDAGFALSGNVREIAVTGSAIRFSPVDHGLPDFSVELRVGLRGAPGTDPVLEIHREPAELPPRPDPFPPGLAGKPMFAAGSEKVIGAPGFPVQPQHPAATFLLGQMQQSGLLGTPAPAAPVAPVQPPRADQRLSVEWMTQAGPRSRDIAIGTPVTLEGYIG